MKPILLLTLAALLALAEVAHAQGTAFTYQGRLTDGANAAGGIYDLRFTIYDTPGGSTLVAGPVTNSAVAISNGLFTVTLDFGAGVFTGADRWLFLSVKTNGAVSFTPLTPPQKVTAAPYAITAGNLTGPLPSASLSGTYPNAVTLNNPANSFSGNGAGLTNLTALTLGGLSSSNFWKSTGNAGATPGANFLGTTDNQPLELKVNGTRALRLEPNPSGAPNVIGGSSNNFAAAGVVGATIGGGGAGNVAGLAYTNRVGANFGTVSGGGQNTIQTDAAFATIGGGTRNTIQTNATSATLGGGELNQIRAGATWATVGGGNLNVIGTDTTWATIAGGGLNAIANDSSYTTIGGGYQNAIQALNQSATIGGGNGNVIQPSTGFATIGGGSGNIVQRLSTHATIGGGNQNVIQANANYATIPGGLLNSAGNYAFAAGSHAKADHDGSFVWADSAGADFTSSGNNQFLIRATGNVGINKRTPTTALDVNGTVTATGFSGNGAGLANVTALTLGGLSSSNLWKTAGNAGANPANGAFLGTTDLQPLEFKVNNQRGLRLEPGGSNSVNVIGGWMGNGVAPGVAGATIGGGGAGGYFGFDYTNRVEAHFGTVSGGMGNTVQSTAYFATISGGDFNTIQTNAAYAAIGGGDHNTIHPYAFYATVGGGQQNTIQPTATHATIGGGIQNTIHTNAEYATIGGGNNNSIRPNADSATIAGGNNNTIQTNAYYGTIGGGIQNRIETDARFSTIGGGVQNTIPPNAEFATIPGGLENSATNYAFAAGTFAKANHTGAFVWADHSTPASFASTGDNQLLIRAAGGVAIGTNDPAGAALRVAGTIKADAFLGMGTTLLLGTTDDQPLEFMVNNRRALRLEQAGSNSVNVIGGWVGNGVAPGVVGATVAGGGAGDYFGVAHTNRVEADFGTVSGGAQNTVQTGGGWATIGGGLRNTIQAAGVATIGGGAENVIDSALFATIGGGVFNTISNSAQHATISGGYHNTIQSYANDATIGGGFRNTIQTRADDATIGGGNNNSIWSSADYATIGGGNNNRIQYSAEWATIGGGSGNMISSAADYATIGGGAQNTIHPDAISAAIGGGDQNTIQTNADYATIPGGKFNSATNQAFAAGSFAKANHTGAFVWADSQNADFASTANDQFSIRASGGVRFASGASGREVMTILNNGFVGINTSPGVPDAFLTVNGSASKPGGGAWSVSSDERLKKNIRPLAGVLEKLLALRGVSYEYKEPEKIHELSGERIGMIAQEVEKVFPDWVETGASGYKRLTVRGFEALTVEALRELRAEKDAQISALERRLEKLERLMNRENGGEQ